MHFYLFLKLQHTFQKELDKLEIENRELRKQILLDKDNEGRHTTHHRKIKVRILIWMYSHNLKMLFFIKYSGCSEKSSHPFTACPKIVKIYCNFSLPQVPFWCIWFWTCCDILKKIKYLKLPAINLSVTDFVLQPDLEPEQGNFYKTKFHIFEKLICEFKCYC